MCYVGCCKNMARSPIITNCLIIETAMFLKPIPTFINYGDHPFDLYHFYYVGWFWIAKMDFLVLLPFRCLIICNVYIINSNINYDTLFVTFINLFILDIAPISLNLPPTLHFHGWTQGHKATDEAFEEVSHICGSELLVNGVAQMDVHPFICGEDTRKIFNCPLVDYKINYVSNRN